MAKLASILLLLSGKPAVEANGNCYPANNLDGFILPQSCAAAEPEPNKSRLFLS
jgi:hypothetical protein